MRDEAPILAHRVRKAALAGCKVSLLSTRAQQCHFPVLRQAVVDPAGLALELAALARRRSDWMARRRPLVDSLASGRSAIVLGGVAMRHTHFADIRAAAATLAAKTGATLGFLPDGGNAAGTALAGALPHRLPGGRPDPSPGLDVARMLESPLAGCVLLGGIEPAHDIGVGRRPGGARGLPPPDRDHAVRGPRGHGRRAGPAADGQLCRNLGQLRERRRPLAGVPRLRPAGRRVAPGWKILRVLGNQLGLEGFGYESSADVLAELRALAGAVGYDGRLAAAVGAASRSGAAKRRTFRSTAWTPWCAARRRCR